MPQELSASAKRTIFAILMCCAFLAMLDSQIVATALPTIVQEFGGMEQYSWVAASYLITHSAVMPISGKLGDLFGRKTVLLAAVVIFLLGSLACGVAPSMNSLIAARLFQGLGAGGIIVSVFAVTSDLFEPRERARYQSFSSLVLLLSAAVGPVLGGVMTEYWGWRSIFLANLPLGGVALVLLIKVLPDQPTGRKPKIDYLGGTVIAALVTCLVIWSDSPQLFGSFTAQPAIALLAGLIILSFVFVWAERRAPEPIIALSILRHRVIWKLLAISVGAGSIALGLANFHALYLQKTTGLAPSAAGSFFIVLMLGISAGSLVSGRWISRTGQYRKVMCLGLAGCAVMFLLLAFLPAGQPLWVLGVLFAGLGLTSGLGQQVPTLLAQLHAPKKDLGSTTGAVSLFRIAGAAVATSLYGSILNQRLPSEGSAAAADLGPAEFAHAFTGVYGLAAAVMVACCILGATLPAKQD